MNRPTGRTSRGSAIAWAVLLTGCGSGAAAPRDGDSGSGASDGGATTDVEDEAAHPCDGGCWQPPPNAEAFIISFCALSESCCVRNDRHPQPDPLACESRLRKLGITGDPALTAACLSEMQRLANTLDCVPELWDLADSCVRAFNEPGGPQPPGAECTVAADCAGAPGTVTLCSPTPFSGSKAPLTCVRMTPGKQNDHPCLGGISAEGAIHGQAISADGSATSPIIASGAGCEARAGLYCKYEIDQPESYCEAVSPDGTACVLPETCASGACGDGVCAARVPAGASCAIAAGNVVCDSASWCQDRNVCLAKVAAGGACPSSAACLSLNCKNNVCSPQSHAEDFALPRFCGP